MCRARSLALILLVTSATDLALAYVVVPATSDDTVGSGASERPLVSALRGQGAAAPPVRLGSSHQGMFDVWVSIIYRWWTYCIAIGNPGNTYFDC